MFRPPIGQPGPAPKSTTIYVGKIAPTVEDDVIKGLLEACGTVKSWKPVLDPETQKSKGFGFCEYQSPEAVLRALRLLNNLALDGQELLLKCNTATERYIAQYQERKQQAAREAAAQAQGPPGVDPQPNGTAGADPEAAEDDQKLASIMALVSARAAAFKARQAETSAAAQADEFLAELLPPPPKRSRADGAGSGTPTTSARDRDQARDRSRTGDRGRTRGASRSERERGHSSREPADAAAEAEREMERRRKQERREAEARAAEAEREYARRLKEFERYERQRLKDTDGLRDQRKAAEKDRSRLLRDDAEHEDEDERLPAWQRKLIASTSRCEVRRRKRAEEAAQDTANAERLDHLQRKHQRRIEKEEAAAAERARQREAEAAAAATTNGNADEGSAEGASAASPAPAKIDPDDAILQAMMAQANRPAPQAASPSPSLQGQPAASPRPEGGSAAARPAAAVRRPVAPAFGGDDDEDEQPKRRLVPLQYSEEEQKAAAAAAAEPAKAGPAQEPAADAQAQIAALKQGLPKTKDTVFGAPIKWETYAAAQPGIGEKVGKWVGGQIKKLLGQEEASLRDFVLDALAKQTGPKALLEELEPIFDNEAEEFIIKLFQVVLFETGRFEILGH